ncbi:vitamin-B12 independent methionine synthase [Gordonia shandongensis]|uniref:vitamin-B12 independent methionine synthase n=1 Tax=Gordonia shandongensis TaxID=376351 RepID=UPI00047B1AF6|nr:vitamin-B12 independent methionine synthase [Gordonia shandongensis]
MTPTSSMPAGVGTGIGSMPGTDPREAVAVMAGETGLAFLPELPARGVGADLIGRTGALLIDIPLDHVHRAYRLTARPTSVTRRARDLLRWDLDALEERWERAGAAGDGRAVKVQACGPWTFAAHAELRGGHRIVRDAGAVRDVAESLAYGLRDHVDDVRRRTGASVVVQLDEPSVGSVLDGAVTPLTRLDPIAPVPAPDVAELLASTAAIIGAPTVVHSCAAPRWELVRLLPDLVAGVDLSLISDGRDLDALGEYLDAGRVLVAGVIPVDAGTSRGEPDALVDDAAGRLAGLVDRIGLPRSVLTGQVTVAPACGLAGVTPAQAALVLRVCSTVAERL